jgi:Flp pilus assembly protein TadD
VLEGQNGSGDGILKINQAIFHPAALPDLRQAARLTPNDPLAWGSLAMLEVLAEGFQRGVRSPEELLTRELWPTLPERSQTAVRECLTQLESIGQSADPRLASSALGILGTLQFFVVRDTTGGAVSLRRATALDPSNGNAWETLTFALAYSRQFAPMIGVCDDRLKQRDSVRNRVLLAKAYERNDRLDAMLEEASAAQRRYPDNLLANLTLGAALLRAKRSDLGRARALQFIARATQLAGEDPPEEVATELLFQRGLYFALSGQHAVARAEFRRLLEVAPGHPEAAEAVKALEQAGD